MRALNVPAAGEQTVSRKLGLAPADTRWRQAAAETVGDGWIAERLAELHAVIKASLPETGGWRS